MSKEDSDTIDNFQNEDYYIQKENMSVSFKEEDLKISKLYRKVVDSIMSENKLREKTVDSAIEDMKRMIQQGHKKSFRNYRDIDFTKPSKCCAYLRRYAICHTGLVKQIMWEFFSSQVLSDTTMEVKNEITQQNHLKIISLGGGPGNDFVGFCSALQENPNVVEQFDLFIVDICKSWKSVFQKIIQEAHSSKDGGSFSRCVQEKKISYGFLEADLTADRIFKNKALLATLGDVHIVLMIKVTSFLPNKKAEKLINGVVKCMKTGAKLIFIDEPYDEDYFRHIRSLLFVYSSATKYELSFKPSRFKVPSISSTQAHVGIFKKI